MTQEQKELLLKELYTRIPYGVKVNAPFTTNKNENAKGYRISGITSGIVEWTPILFGEKKQRNSIVIEAFSEKFNQFCSIDIELNNDIERVKLYLFPLSSMTEEQEKEFKDLYYRFHESAFIFNERFAYDRYSIKDIGFYPCYLQDWLNKNHFDYRGLIPMGLAIDATNLNIY